MIGKMKNDKFGLILVTHSSLSKSYLEALELILDINKSEIDAVSFEAGEEIDKFEGKLVELINNKYKSKNLIMLLDILGGTPANIAAKFLSPSVKLITGINLPLVLEIAIMRENNIQLNDINIDEIIKNSQKGLICINDLLPN
ncbi:hypothetical protein [Clostridium paraputrificum]|uniref:PTS system fructose IIA component n=2 Tax=Clostridium TaxID=1485 RepID=A0A6N3ES12_9CLOT